MIWQGATQFTRRARAPRAALSNEPDGRLGEPSPPFEGWVRKVFGFSGDRIFLFLTFCLE